jgi:diguanylate cyclase (GGDEF)-like protein
LAQTARLVAEGHGLDTLAVLEGPEVAGYVSLHDLVRAEPGARVAEFLQPCPLVLHGEVTVREAARLFAESKSGFAPVLHAGQFLGIVTVHQVLSAVLGEGDSLTGLRWSEALRDWAAERLGSGREICVFSFDIAEFAHFNRRYGYAIGDRLLVAVAQTLSALTEPEREILVRHSGDEFLVATTRDREAALALADRLHRATSEAIRDAGLGLVPISLGFSGGFRTSLRETTHTAAMVDDLIRLAQKDASQRREVQAKAEPSESEPQAPGAPRVLEVHQSSDPVDPAVSVAIRLPEGTYTGRASLHGSTEAVSIRDLSFAVAAAVALAVERAHPEVRMVIDDVSAFDQADGSRLVSVFGKLQSPAATLGIAGSARVEGGLAESVAEATLQAFLNRDLASVRR